MTVVAPPPNPSLIAIILVIQARSGPRFVYHYPPTPLSKPVSGRTEDVSRSYESSSDSEDDFSAPSDEDVFPDGHGRGSSKHGPANVTDEEDEDSPMHGTNPRNNGVWRVPWEHLFGLDASALERLLMPSDRSWHKRRFEVGFNELVFIGWPVFIREDGTWRKKRRKEKAFEGKAKDIEVSKGGEGLPRDSQNSLDQLDSPEKVALTRSMAKDEDSVPAQGSREMTVFNVVFVLNPPILEYSLRVKEMYDHVVKKLGRALKWEQARANYVWKQSEIILEAKAKARHQSLCLASPCRSVY